MTRGPNVPVLMADDREQCDHERHRGNGPA
jgi:hypothetical protein